MPPSPERYLRFWGVRGSYAAPFPSHLGVGGNTSCVELHADGHTLVCDAGTGIIPLGERLMQQSEGGELLVLLTHYHWDHICGLPFFTPAFSPRWRIGFFGPGRSREDIEGRIAGQMRAPYFPVETETWRADVHYVDPTAEHLEHGPFSITRQSVHHPGVTYGYRIEVGGKSVVYVSDNEFLFLDRSIEHRAAEFNAEERDLFDRIRDEERETELDVIRGADILIHDAQYTPHDYASKRGWGHSCYIDTVNSAIDAGVRQLYLYHHDPNYDDGAVEDIHRHALEIIDRRGSDMACHVAREGVVVPL